MIPHQYWAAGRRWGRVQLAALLLLLGAPPVRGQAPLVTGTLDSATVVRLHFVADGVAEGPLLAPFGRTSASLRYCPSRTPPCAATEVPVATVSYLDVQTGTRAARGFLVGTVAVGVVVTPLIYIGGSFAQGETRASLLTKGIALSVIVGGGLGLLIGHSVPTWSHAP